MIKAFLGCLILLGAAAYAEDAAPAKKDQAPSYFSEKALTEAKPGDAKPAATEKKAESPKTASAPAKKAEPAEKPETKKTAASILEDDASLPGIPVNKKHKVVDGDTLWDISNKYYGDPFKWGKIYNFNLNLVKNPDLIYPDNEIEIPDIKETVVPEIKKPVISSGAEPGYREKAERAMTDSEAGKEAGYLPGAPQEDAVETLVAAETPKPAETDEIVMEPEILPEVEETTDPMALSEKMPEGQLSFAGMSKTLKVDKKFFDGEVLEKVAEDEMERAGFIQSGDTLKVKLYSPDGYAPGDRLAVYQKGVETGGRMTVQYVGNLKIISINGKKATCRVLKVNTVVDGTMYVKKPGTAGK